MKRHPLRPLLACLVLPSLVLAQSDDDPAFRQDVDTYNDHIVTLASPWMEGRLPGTRGMELAREYMEYYFRQANLEPAFDGSFRQPFELAPRFELISSELSFGGTQLAAGSEYTALFAGSSGSVTASPAEMPAASAPISRPRTPIDQPSKQIWWTVVARIARSTMNAQFNIKQEILASIEQD